MKTPDQAQLEQFNLRESDKEIFRDIVNKITAILQSEKISEQTAFEVLSMKNDLDGMGERFMWKLLNLAKKNYQID